MTHTKSPQHGINVSQYSLLNQHTDEGNIDVKDALADFKLSKDNVQHVYLQIYLLFT